MGKLRVIDQTQDVTFKLTKKKIGDHLVKRVILLIVLISPTYPRDPRTFLFVLSQREGLFRLSRSQPVRFFKERVRL